MEKDENLGNSILNFLQALFCILYSAAHLRGRRRGRGRSFSADRNGVQTSVPEVFRSLSFFQQFVVGGLEGVANGAKLGGVDMLYTAFDFDKRFPR